MNGRPGKTTGEFRLSKTGHTQWSSAASGLAATDAHRDDSCWRSWRTRCLDNAQRPGGRSRGPRRAEVRRPSLGRELARHGHERALVAAVPAQPGERDEDLAAVGDDPGRPASVSPASLTRRATDVSRCSCSPLTASSASTSSALSDLPASARATAREICCGVVTDLVGSVKWSLQRPDRRTAH